MARQRFERVDGTTCQFVEVEPSTGETNYGTVAGPKKRAFCSPARVAAQIRDLKRAGFVAVDGGDDRLFDPGELVVFRTGAWDRGGIPIGHSALAYDETCDLMGRVGTILGVAQEPLGLPDRWAVYDVLVCDTPHTLAGVYMDQLPAR